MRIVILTQWYLPEPAQLISGLAQTLSEFGHDVTVLTGFTNYPTGRLYPGYRLRLWQRETIRGVKVVRVPLFPSHDASAIKRTFNYISFAFCASLFGWFLLRRPDVIHVYHPPLTAVAPGWFLSRLFRVPLTLEIQSTERGAMPLLAASKANWTTGCRVSNSLVVAVPLLILPKLSQEVAWHLHSFTPSCVPRSGD